MARKTNEAHRERKRELATVRRDLVEARAALRETHSRVRAFVKQTRAAVQEHARQLHRHVTDELRATLLSEKQAAQGAHAARLDDIRAIDSDLVRVGAKLASTEQLKSDLARAESAYLKHRSQAPAITCIGVRAETDDEVRQHLPEELIPLFDRMKRTVNPGQNCSRTAAFLTYAFAHPEEVTAAAGHPHHVAVAQLEQMEVKLSTQVDRHSAARRAETTPAVPSRAIVLASSSAIATVATPNHAAPGALRAVASPKTILARVGVQRGGATPRLAPPVNLRSKPVQLEHASLAGMPILSRATPHREAASGGQQSALALVAPGSSLPLLRALRALPALPPAPKTERLQSASASYDPGDNKLRMRSSRRLDPETYRRMKAAGFSWAPKQDLFVAPAWTPEREELLIELCGEIGDEDTSLVDRAEGRAERFEGYQERRAAEAAGAHRAVEAVSRGFEFGQPILVGHHSERRARKDAERIETGMRKAVSLWKTSQYWEERAKGALRHAKNKERVDVRHRRIKALESDRRKEVRRKEDAERFQKLWSNCTTLERALAIANYDHLRTDDTVGPDGKVLKSGTTFWSALNDGAITVEWARIRAIQVHETRIRYSDRWIEHLDHRLAYERAMLNEGGGIPAAKFDLQVGGQVLERYGWAVILRLNRKAGAIVSATVAGRHGKSVCGLEEIRDYRPPAEGDAARVAAATKLAPLVNFPGEGFRHVTQAEWDNLSKHSDFARARRVAATEAHGAYRVRMAPKVGRPYYDIAGVYVTDAKRVDPPAPSERARLPERETEAPPAPRPPKLPTEPTVFDSMAQSLKTGVKAVSADQLFPTPPELAARVVGLANVRPGDRVLEPSVGTGNLLRAVLKTRAAYVVAVEVNEKLARALAPKDGGKRYSVRHADFLTLGVRELGIFDCVVMNPPFANGADVKHILHARTLLGPGGRIVAICANGARQASSLKPLADTWEELPAGAFVSSGTGVRSVLLTMRAAASHPVAEDRAAVASEKDVPKGAVRSGRGVATAGTKRLPTKLKVVGARKVAPAVSAKRRRVPAKRKGVR